MSTSRGVRSGVESPHSWSPRAQFCAYSQTILTSHYPTDSTHADRLTRRLVQHDGCVVWLKVRLEAKDDPILVARRSKSYPSGPPALASDDCHPTPAELGTYRLWMWPSIALAAVSATAELVFATPMTNAVKPTLPRRPTTSFTGTCFVDSAKVKVAE